jgi:3-oxoacyl-[acyl-carrier protein] reductase
MKRALITAATSSIGSVLSEHLSKLGYELVLHYHANKQLAERLAKGTSAELLTADLTDRSEIERLLESLQSMAKFDVIINNAGKSAVTDDRDMAMWELFFRMNAVVPALIMARAPDIMNSSGVIINVSSIYGHERFGAADMAAYDASKAALNSLTRTFAKKLAPDIRVNAIAPGFVDSAWNKNYSSVERQMIEAMQLTNRLVTPEQIADLAAHIIENPGLDGEIIYLDGGQTLKTL